MAKASSDRPARPSICNQDLTQRRQENSHKERKARKKEKSQRLPLNSQTRARSYRSVEEGPQPKTSPTASPSTAPSERPALNTGTQGSAKPPPWAKSSYAFGVPPFATRSPLTSHFSLWLRLAALFPAQYASAGFGAQKARKRFVRCGRLARTPVQQRPV